MGTTLSFSIQNAPAWATFSSATGQLSGTPAAGNAGSYSNIVISVSDGSSTEALAPFSITVTDLGATTTLAAKNTGELGIGGDPTVVWYENFDEGSVRGGCGTLRQLHE